MLSNIWNKVFATPAVKSNNRRIVIKPMNEDMSSSQTDTSNPLDAAAAAAAADKRDPSDGNSSNGSRTVRGSYRPPLPSDSVSTNSKPTGNRPFGFHIFSKQKNQTRTNSAEDSYSTVQLSTFVNDHTAGYGGRVARNGSGSGGSSNLDSSTQSNSSGYELSESQKEALRVPMDLYQAAASLFGSTFLANHVNNNTNNVGSSSYTGGSSSGMDRRYAHGVSHGLYSSVSTVEDGDGGYPSNRSHNIQNSVEESLSL